PTAADSHAQRCRGPLGDLGHARVSVPCSKSRQLVNENLVPLSLHVLPARSHWPDPPASVAPTGCGVVADTRSVCRAADPVPPNSRTCVTEMRATVYLLPAEGNCWVSIWTRGGYIKRSWATMDKCMRNPGWGYVPTR